MKFFLKLFTFCVLFTVFLTSCGERVAPNYYGVLMENYGKDGEKDYTFQQGRVNTFSPGTELFQVPAWKQASRTTEKLLHLKSLDKTEFTAKPVYSYEVDKADGDKTQLSKNVVSLVFQNARLGSGESFMTGLEDNVLEPAIYEMLKEESMARHRDTLMADGGGLKFEKDMQKLVRAYFKTLGLHLVSYTTNLDFSQKVKKKIDTINETNTNITLLNLQKQEQIIRNELAFLKAKENATILTPEYLQLRFIEAWEKTKQPIYGSPPIFTKTLK